MLLEGNRQDHPRPSGPSDIWTSTTQGLQIETVLFEPVIPMPVMQQGIWILHTVSSSCVYQLRSAWTLLSLFL